MTQLETPVAAVARLICVPRNERLIREVLNITREIEASGASPLTARRRQLRKIRGLLLENRCLVKFNKKGPDDNLFVQFKGIDACRITVDVVNSPSSYHSFLHEVSHFLLHFNYAADNDSYRHFRRERFLMEGQADSLAQILALKNNRMEGVEKHAGLLCGVSKFVSDDNVKDVYKRFWYDVKTYLGDVYAR